MAENPPGSLHFPFFNVMRTRRIATPSPEIVVKSTLSMSPQPISCDPKIVG